MGHIVKTFDFASNDSNFVQTAGSLIVYAYESVDGSPGAGCAKFTAHSTVGLVPGETARANRNITGETWQTWGVPAGATVTQVQVTAWKGRQFSTSSLFSNLNMRARVIGSDNSTILVGGDLFDAVYPPASGFPGSAWTAMGSQTARQIIQGADVSTYDVRLQLEVYMRVGSYDFDTIEDLRFDTIDLTITYTDPGGGGKGYPGTASRIYKARKFIGRGRSFPIAPGVAIYPGDLVALNSAGQIVLAGDTNPVLPADGFAVNVSYLGHDGQQIGVADGRVRFAIARHGTISGFTGLTPGGDVWLSDTPGGLTGSATSRNGDVLQKLGTAISAETVEITVKPSETNVQSPAANTTMALGTS